ncbi:MAG: glutamate--cysteine ligase [Methanosphaera sp. rholeuAM6]|nr:MAG: glutamate--cysteine ligase [Methanosphaera sp. rholeuAM6]
MNNIFTTDNIKKTLTPEEILSGNFGFEKEGLRVNAKGELSLTPHPEVFADKLKNPYITTDFSESQVEIVTPTFNNVNEAYHCLSFLVDITNTSIPHDQYIWNQSLPCILPDKYMIPIAQYEGKKGEESLNYRINLAKKYGTLKQMISGIHYNFSFSEETLKKLHRQLAPEKSYKNFKNEAYLKVVRNYNRYKWFIIYITGASISAHKTFTQECLDLMHLEDGHGSHYSNQGPSYRNSRIGYKNLEALYPRYDSVEHFCEDVNGYINEGILSEAKELYTQIRLKPKDPTRYLDSLKEDGILYVEVRSIDINPFDKCGIDKNDAHFMHLFMIYLLVKEETDYPQWQKEGLYNEEETAQNAFNPNTRLLKQNKKIPPKKWAKQIIREIHEINRQLNLQKSDVIDKVQERINNSQLTYARRLEKIIENKGFIPSQLSIAQHNKDTSYDIIDYETIKNSPKLYEYYTHALPNNKI